MRKILISTLFTSLIATSIPAITSCNTSTKDDSVVKTTVQNTIKKNETKHVSSNNSISTTIVKFRAKQGEEQQVTFSGAVDVKARVGRTFATVAQPAAWKDGYLVTHWVDSETGKKVEPSTPITENMTLYPFFENEVQLKNCLGLAAIQDSTITMVNHGEHTPNVSYSKNGLIWTQYKVGDNPITVHSGEVVYFRGQNSTGFSWSETDYTSFVIGGAVSVNGNVMTLIDDGVGTTDAIPNDYCFYKLFEGCSGIVSISSNFLPATKLKKYSYAYMFLDCKCLTVFPKTLLPAKILNQGEDYSGTMCYMGMFKDCTSIKKIPQLPATTLSTGCYYGMFQNCTSLTALHQDDLPATSLSYACYYCMFSNCSGLTTLDENCLIPTTGNPTLALRCYSGMFANCTGLTQPEITLPLTDLSSGQYCYEEMFYGCTSLTKAPALPATTLSEGCYSGMFYNCSSLPSDGLPTMATVSGLQDNCFQYMFYNCTSLTNIPTLSYTTLAPYCYKDMFHGCTGLGDLSSTSLPATTLAAHSCENMFYGCTSLTSTPTFPSSGTITLDESCFDSMFCGCTALTSSPALIATDAAKNCYDSMFYNCSNLTSAGKISLTTFADECCYMMFANCEKLNVDGSDSQTNYVIYLPDETTYKANVDMFSNMFQDTKNYINAGWNPYKTTGPQQQKVYCRYWYIAS